MRYGRPCRVCGSRADCGSLQSDLGSAPSPARLGSPPLPYRERLDSPSPALDRTGSASRSRTTACRPPLCRGHPPSPGTGEGLRSKAQGEGAMAADARRTPDLREKRSRGRSLSEDSEAGDDTVFLRIPYTRVARRRPHPRIHPPAARRPDWRPMKAIVYRDYGSADVLHCEDVEKPAPGDHEVLVRVRAAAANPMD